MSAQKKWEVAQKLQSIHKPISHLFTVPESPERTATITELREKLRSIGADLDTLKGSRPNPKKPGELKAMRHTLSRLFWNLKQLMRRAVSERTPGRLRHDLSILQHTIEKTRDHLEPTFRSRNFPARDTLRRCIDERGKILAVLATVRTENNRKEKEGGVAWRQPSK